jgi:hypothetical protein
VGVKVSSLARQQDTLRIEVGPGEDEVVEVVYRPGALTLEIADRLRELQDSPFQVDAALVLLEPMLVSWDLLDDNNEPLPVTAEGIKQVPLQFLGKLIEKMQASGTVDPEEGKASGDSSLQEAGQVTRLPGSSSFEPRSTTDVNPGNSLSSQ